MATEILPAASPAIGFPAAERERAEWTREALERELGAMRERDHQQENAAIAIGRYLRDVSQYNWYRLYGYERFGDYFRYLVQRFGKERSTLYGYKGAVEQLDGHISDADLERIGIEKAKVMARAARFSADHRGPQQGR